MSADIITFPIKASGGIVYVVFGGEIDRPHDGEWLVYSQPAGADEPDLAGFFDDIEMALADGCRLAADLGARFLFEAPGGAA